jgi:ribonuclease P/MRP protein subunit POP5
MEYKMPKRLPPSLRPKARYVAFEIISEQPIRYEEWQTALWNTALDFLGEFGLSSARLWPIKNLYNPTTQKGLLKCSHTAVEQIRVVLSLIQMIGETRAVVHVLGVTGTIKSAEMKYLKEEK